MFTLREVVVLDRGQFCRDIWQCLEMLPVIPTGGQRCCKYPTTHQQRLIWPKRSAVRSGDLTHCIPLNPRRLAAGSSCSIFSSPPVFCISLGYVINKNPSHLNQRLLHLLLTDYGKIIPPYIILSIL